MKKSELVKILNNIFDYSNCEDWDNCGPNKYIDEEITQILVTLDITNKIIDYAIKNKCNVIITHHPILLNQSTETSINSSININNINMNNKLIKNNILHISLHTCFDRYKFGTSYQIYKSFNIEHLVDEENWIMDYIYLVKLKKPIKIKDILPKICNKYTVPISLIQEQENNIIQNIAIGAGSCSNMINDLTEHNIDLFLTGDIKWHAFIDAYNINLNIIDINHYSESVFINYISNIIKDYNLKVINKDLSIKILSYSN